MALNWDDDDEDQTELEYRRPSSKVVVHEEVTTPVGNARDYRREFSPPPPSPPPSFSPPLQSPQLRPARAYTPAPIRDRFAAFLIDTWILFYVYWLVGYALIRFFNLSNIQALHQNNGRFAIHVALTFVIGFFYYLLMESTLGATVGKMFCRLKVVEENGQSASIGNTFMRNFLRLVDYPLGFLIAVITMESSPFHQRLGDRAAKTMVIRRARGPVSRIDLQHTAVASTLSRIFAECIDLVLALTLLYGIFLMLKPKHPLFAYVVFVSLPVVFIFYYTVLELISGTTPGKALFRRKVVTEHGEPLDGTASLIRNLFRPLDYLIGYPLLVITQRKQRLGDLAADTLVVVQPPGRNGVLAAFFAVGIIVIVAYLGFKNPDNFIRKDYNLTPMQGIKLISPTFRQSLSKGAPLKASTVPEKTTPSIPTVTGSSLPTSTSDKLKVTEFYFSSGPEPGQLRPDKIFRTGDLIYAFFKIQGYELSPLQEIFLTQDLKVEGPDGKEIFSQQEIVKLSKKITEPTQNILFANNIKLPKGSPPGKYRAIFTVKDQVAGKQFSFEEFFELQ